MAWSRLEIDHEVEVEVKETELPTEFMNSDKMKFVESGYRQ